MTVPLTGLALGLSLLALPGHSTLEVGLDVDACLELPVAEVRRLTALELTTRVVDTAARERPAATVHVTCAGRQALIRVTDPTTGKTLERTLDLTRAGVDVRSRAVALAAAELVLTSWMELMLEGPSREPSLAPESPNRRAATELVRARSEHGARVDYILALAQTSSTFEGKGFGFGGGVRLGWRAALNWLGADADLVLTQAHTTTALGQVRTQSWSLAARPALRLSGHYLFGGVGLGARIGLARVEGIARDAKEVRAGVVAGSWGGPLAHAQLGLKFAHFAAYLGLEAGYALRGVSGRVAGDDRAGVKGAWVSATLGLGWCP